MPGAIISDSTALRVFHVTFFFLLVQIKVALVTSLLGSIIYEQEIYLFASEISLPVPCT